MRRGSRYSTHVAPFLVGVSSSQRSVPGRKSHVLVSEVLTGVTGIETQIIYDSTERWLWQPLMLSPSQSFATKSVQIYTAGSMSILLEGTTPEGQNGDRSRQQM